MRSFGLVLSCVALGSAVAYATGCSSSSSGNGGGGGGGGGTPPHALGAILVGESHAPGSVTSTPTVTAAFLPDASMVPQTCSTQVAGCTLTTTPVCGAMGCGSGATCTFDASCQPTCQPACTLACGAGQQCYFASPNQPACRTTETFDAGALVFVGTTTPITLFPPYTYQGTAGIPPFTPATQIQVQASGASGAGFDAFMATTNATSLMKTNPPINQLPSATVFGLGALPIGWIPGSDTVTVSVAGAGGVVTCAAEDSSGQFQIPRAAIQAAQGAMGGSALSIAVTREHDDWNKSASTHGTLSTATVQPVGWVEISTVSSEAATIQGCPVTSETMCPDGCFDTSTDPLHCGSCTIICGSGQSCVSGQCTTGTTTDTCTTCETSADAATCAGVYATCTEDANCTSYGTCVQACTAGDTTCLDNCETEYPTGSSEFSSYEACICQTACTTQCATECAATP
jgi:hypothetical protein